MHKRLYIVAALFLLSLVVITSTAFSNDRLLDVKYTQLTPAAKKQVDCLADNIYYEAGYEPDDGKKAVALVTLNRVQDERFGKDICSVVKQKVKSTCQFSWYCEGKKAIRNMFVYNEARDIAVFVYANYENMRDITKGALYYHADYVNPRWKLEKTTTIGRHIFYKERDGI
jgi:spore germination cell wall hydrolase CwlJ-like protein